MRTVSSLLMATLAVAAMLWGNCLCCPQILTAMTAHQPAHNCCPKPKPVSTICPTQGIRHFVKADAAAQAPAVPVVAGLVEPGAPVSLPRQWISAPVPAEHGPPDVLSLTTSLRI